MIEADRGWTRHPLGMVGATLAIVSGALILVVIAAGLLGFDGGPYLGIFTFLVLPAFFILGLLLIPLGVALLRRRERRLAATGEAAKELPIFDLNDPRTRRVGVVVLALTAVNIVVVALAGYQGVHLMETTTFCGSCHSVMDPEFTAHARSAHSRVRCVQCHIGPGASWFVKSKVDGLWQVVSVNMDLYPRPIPTPLHDLRPARETCEQCHWPDKFVGDRLKVITRHAEDETNTPLQTVLLLHVGGGPRPDQQGIHAHVRPGMQIRYRSDPTRQAISTVEATLPGGEVRTYEKPGAATDGEWRVMDCVDCHNRPSHVFRLPEDELDAAMASGRIDPALPFVRREGLKALKVDYPTHDAARAGIATAVRSYYEGAHAAVFAEKRAAIDAAAAELGAIYARNVWPEMKIGWGTYKTHLGHMSSDGCFRCHDEEHTTKDGKTLSQDCGLCHTLLADGEKDPPILKQLRP